MSDENIKIALQKQTPVKVLDKHKTIYGFTEGECPVCNAEVSTLYNYCPECGQLLEW